MESQLTLLSITLLVVIYMPGYLFRKFYFSGKFSKQLKLGEATEKFITTILFGVLLQLFTYKIANKVFQFNEQNFLNFAFSLYGKISSADTDPAKTDTIVKTLNTIPVSSCLYYLFISFFVSALMGTCIHRIVRIFRLDIKFDILKFSNEWEYILKGENLKLLNPTDRLFKIISTEVDILVLDGGEKTTLFSGLLEDYTLSDTTGDLDLIKLRNANRWSKTTNSFKPIPGDCFTIPYKNALNLNLRFNKIFKPRFTFGNRSYPMAILRVLLTIFAVVTFTLPIAIFYTQYGSSGFLRCLLTTLFSWLTWIFIAAVLFGLSEYLKQRRTPPSNPNDLMTSKMVATMFGLVCFFLLISLTLYFKWDHLFSVFNLHVPPPRRQ